MNAKTLMNAPLIRTSVTMDDVSIREVPIDVNVSTALKFPRTTKFAWINEKEFASGNSLVVYALRPVMILCR